MAAPRTFAALEITGVIARSNAGQGQNITLLVDTEATLQRPIPGIVPCPKGLQIHVTFWNTFNLDYLDGAFVMTSGGINVEENGDTAPRITLHGSKTRA